MIRRLDIEMVQRPAHVQSPAFAVIPGIQHCGQGRPAVDPLRQGGMDVVPFRPHDHPVGHLSDPPAPTSGAGQPESNGGGYRTADLSGNRQPDRPGGLNPAALQYCSNGAHQTSRIRSPIEPASGVMGHAFRARRRTSSAKMTVSADRIQIMGCCQNGGPGGTSPVVAGGFRKTMP